MTLPLIKSNARMVLALVPAILAWLAIACPAYSETCHTVTVTNQVYIEPCAKWHPRFWLGNLDDPVPPPDYRPNVKHRVRRWYFRNPGHNFNFYVIGIADKTFRRSGRFPDRNFNPRPGWNWTVCKYKWVRLPFISYNHRGFKLYLGWRERGDFGIELKL
ncbi:MAG: hypothetical protein JWR19_1580 [Pedosphaera sp.]|nr:hypothetical protein [Pedosphaera sp.]